jgi:hypothetical protein
MPMDLKVALRDITPDQAATMLAQAQQAYFNLLTGQLPSGVDTPQLGRVTFCSTNAADLQRLIDYLNGVIANAGNGSSANGWGTPTKVRKPFSFYGWP